MGEQRVSAIGYTRVSTADQAGSGLGLEAQRSAIEEACRERGWDLVRLAEEDPASARTMRRRPELEEALQQLDRGEANALVAARLDRLSRSVIDAATLMERADRRQWTLVALDFGLDLST